MDDGRIKAFRLLKPPCVELSQAALRYKVNKTTAKDLLKCLENLRKTLQAVNRFLDSKLADYVFFPLSHIFGESKRLPSRLLEIALSCLNILVTRGWQDQLSPEVGKQLLILLAFLAGGSATDAKCKDVDEDVGTVAFECMTGIFRASVASCLGSEGAVDPENIPLLGHAVTVILDGISNGPATKVRLAACDSLKALVTGIQDQEALRNFFPGIVSCLAKISSTGVRSKTSYKILQSTIQILELVLCRVVGHEGSSPTQTVSKVSRELGRRDKQWLDATSSQIKLALSNVVAVRYHEREEVLDALFSLCMSVLTTCRNPLATCAPLMMETLTTLSSQASTENTGHRQQQVQQLLASDTDLVEMLKESLQDSIVALPRVVSSNEEIKRTRVIEHISAALQLLFSQNVDLTALVDLTVSNLRSSIAATVGLSSKRAISSSAEGSIEISRILQSSTSSLDRRKFSLVVFDPLSQVDAMTGLQALVRQLQGSTMSTALQQRLAESFQTSSGNEQIGSLWLVLQFLESESSMEQQANQWLRLSGDRMDPLRDDVYSFSLDVLGQSTCDDATDWRLQALSLEVVALQARSQANDFRPELVDALYPILERMGSSIAVLQQHAVTCLSMVSDACGYASASELVIDNADYLVNAVATKLNTFDISPQASQVLLMMVRLCGSPIIPYSDDLIESIFSILALYHGYPRLVESLFEVLNAIVEEGGKPSLQAIESGINNAPTRRKPYKPTSITDLVTRLQSMMSKPLDPTSPPLSPLPEPDPTTDHASQEPPPPTTTSDEPPPLSKSHALIRNVTLQTTHHLSTPSPPLRRLLLTLLTSSIPTLATQTPTDSFLPLIATVWPYITTPLFTSSASAAAVKDNDLPTLLVALKTLATACRYGGSFLLSRTEDSFPALATLCRHLERVYLQEEKQCGKSRASRSLKCKCWDACVELVVQMVEYVGITREMEDGVFGILAGEALVRGKEGVRGCLEGINIDKLWLVEEERIFKGLVGRDRGERWKKPVIEGWDFIDVQFS